MHLNSYYDLERITARIEDEHRGVVGGMWDEIGRLQFEFMVARGLLPGMNLLDIGCGCLRGGVHFVDYLDAGRYYGSDLLKPLLDRGYDIELGKLGLQHKLPRSNLLHDGDFRFELLNVRFDMAIAQSLFTHLPLNHLRLCLAKLAPLMEPGGTFFLTILPCRENEDWARPILHARGGVTSYPHRDPYHYRDADLVACAEGLPWQFVPIGEWDHPRDQFMHSFVRARP